MTPTAWVARSKVLALMSIVGIMLLAEPSIRRFFPDAAIISLSVVPPIPRVRDATAILPL